ncbi:hypothetical protein Q5752_007052 [Cryptotrichosporon argae]
MTVHTRTMPTVFSARSTYATPAQPAQGNVGVSADGQVFVLTSRGATIYTPDLFHALQGADDDRQAGSSRLRRPAGGELGWLTTGIDLSRAEDRGEAYGWGDPDDPIGGLVTDQERSGRAAAWSPSGLHEMGGCFLVLLTSHGQVSVYAPTADPATKAWAELVDLTMLLSMDSGLGDPRRLQLRTTAIAWSPAPPRDSAAPALLVLGSCAGSLTVWSYAGTTLRLAETVHVGSAWIAALAWSEWTAEANGVSAQLAVARNDGSVALIRVTCVAGETVLGTQETVHVPDARQVTALQWVSPGILVFAKPGSVHLWTRSEDVPWRGPRMLRLQRTGNWAGSNPFDRCVAIHQLSPSALVVVLANAAHHVLTDLLAEPAFDTAASLAASLAARDVVLDPMRGGGARAAGQVDGPEHAVTAVVSGWAALGDLAFWAGEPFTFHSLDSVTEGRRVLHVFAADLHLSPASTDERVAALRAMLNDPPALTAQSPLRALLPHAARILADPAPAVLSAVADAARALLDRKADAAPHGLAAIYASPRLDAMRLCATLAGWAARFDPQLEACAAALRTAINADVDRALAGWTREQTRTSTADCVALMAATTDADRGLVGRLCAVDVPAPEHGPDFDPASASTPAARAPAPAAAPADPCVACGTPCAPSSAPDTAVCAHGHVWARCVLTRALVVDQHARTCAACGAVALLPRSPHHAGERDGERGADGDMDADGLADVLLRAARICPRCGGRWARVV